MKLTVKEQYALLVSFYLTLKPSANVKELADTMGISVAFTSQVVTMMKRAGVIKTTRGRNGGMRINADPTVREVLASVKSLNIVNNIEDFTLPRVPEFQVMTHFIGLLSQTLDILYRRKIKNIVAELFVKTAPARQRLTLGTKTTGVMN